MGALFSLVVKSLENGDGQAMVQGPWWGKGMIDTGDIAKDQDYS